MLSRQNLICPVALNYFIPDEKLHFLLLTLMSFLLQYLPLGRVPLSITMLIPPPSLVLAAKLLSNAICYISKVTELHWSQQQSLNNAVRRQPKAGVINHIPLQLMAQPIFHPTLWPLIQSLWSQTDYKPCCQRIHLLLSFYPQSSISSQHTVWLVKHILHLEKPVLSVLSQLVWVLMSFKLPVMAPRLIINITNPDPPSWSYWSCVWHLIFFHHTIIRML